MPQLHKTFIIPNINIKSILNSIQLIIILLKIFFIIQHSFMIYFFINLFLFFFFRGFRIQILRNFLLKQSSMHWSLFSLFFLFILYRFSPFFLSITVSRTYFLKLRIKLINFIFFYSYLLTSIKYHCTYGI